MIPDRLVLERRCFPTRIAAERALRGLYRDRWPVLVGETAHERLYCIEDALVGRPARDPNLACNLREILGISPEEAAHFRSFRARHGGCRLTTLQHTWALEALSKWATRRHPGDPPPLLLHVDAHDDLQPPSLVATTDPWIYQAPVGGDVLDLHDPATVSPFVERGLIGIGGFLVPILHALVAAQVVWLHPLEVRPANTQASLRSATEPFLFFGGCFQRPIIEVEPCDVESAHPLRLLATDNLSSLVSWLTPGPVLVDIDFDYFCNLYDDSQVRPQEPPSHNEVLDHIDRFASELGRILRNHRVELVTLALSPEFFPSAYWPRCLERLEELGDCLLEA